MRVLELVCDAFAGFRQGVEGVVDASPLLHESGGKQPLQVVSGSARRDVECSGDVTQECSLPVESLQNHSTRVMPQDLFRFRCHYVSTIHVAQNTCWIIISLPQYIFIGENTYGCRRNSSSAKIRSGQEYDEMSLNQAGSLLEINKRLEPSL